MFPRERVAAIEDFDGGMGGNVDGDDHGSVRGRKCAHLFKGLTAAKLSGGGIGAILGFQKARAFAATAAPTRGMHIPDSDLQDHGDHHRRLITACNPRASGKRMAQCNRGS
eukprot:3080776-Pleurochrysis_carterae.AAC.1